MRTGYAQVAKRGESECGDDFAIISNDGRLLLAVVDGLGHGPRAAESSRAATEIIRERAMLDVDEIIWHCHRGIVGTRGCQMAVAAIDLEREDGRPGKPVGRLSFSGVGNVEIRSRSTRPITPISMPGIVGRQLRRVIRQSYAVCRGDVIALFSDGLSSKLVLEAYKALDPEAVAAKLVEDHGKDDDRTVVVVEI